jgi:hypothetical protein
MRVCGRRGLHSPVLSPPVNRVVASPSGRQLQSRLSDEWVHSIEGMII